jgi:hypothetical protein
VLGCLAVTNPTDCFAQSRRYTTRALGRAFGITSPPERPARHREARGGGDAIDASPIEGRALSLDRGAANRRFFRAPTWSCHRSFGLSQRTLGADATASPASISRYRAHRYAEQPRGASDGQAQPLPILAHHLAEGRNHPWEAIRGASSAVSGLANGSDDRSGEQEERPFEPSPN